jgi:hypothetical protein
MHILHIFIPSFLTARIDDDDPGYGSDAQHDPRTGQAQPLRVDRWHSTPPEE